MNISEYTRLFQEAAEYGLEGVDGFWNWRRYCRLGDARVIANICRKFGWRAWTAQAVWP